jgi:hypothetical protein
MRFSAHTVLGGLINEYERAPQKPRSGRVAEFWNPTGLLQPPDRITRRRERAWRQPDVTGERVTILAAGKCVAACRRAVLRWARRGTARYVLCIRKEVLAMFANRQTPPGVVL